MKKIVISTSKVTMEAELFDTPTARKIWDALPFDGIVNTWGDEVYFSIPVKTSLEANATDELPVGSLAYWVPGHAFCILFGRTPVSRSDLPCLANPGNHFGKLLGNPTAFRAVRDGETISLKRKTE